MSYVGDVGSRPNDCVCDESTERWLTRSCRIGLIACGTLIMAEFSVHVNVGTCR